MFVTHKYLKCIHHVGLPNNSGAMLGQRRSPLLAMSPVTVRQASHLRSPLLVQCRQINDIGPTLLQHWVCCILSGNTPAKRAIHPMLAQRLRRWPDIETALGDRPMFVGTAHYYADDAFTSCRQKSHYPDNTIHWPNADVMLGHRL